ncbi:uncharacterized protein LOC113082021 [Carassius auratus]|uniref:S100P-binding protein n=1 Tax=Carassius auratus TaxID=7957 RepID=A0A6P6NMH4_CARAU|nr:uncharacterized protein LOC113082021 [Carassius auratus]XP_026109710.1 uncharacterized protein LOC113082021 [Carassius auratus]
MSDYSSLHLKPLSGYSHMVFSKQQYNAISPFYNIQLHISHKGARARKRRLDDSYFDETCETPLKRQCITRTFSLDQGCFSVDVLTGVQEWRPMQPLKSKAITLPRSKVNQPVTPVVSVPLSKCKQNWIDQVRESWSPSQIPALKWDREVPVVEISLRASLNFDICSSVSLDGSQGPVKDEVREVLCDLIPVCESKSHIAPTVVLVKEEEGVSVSQQAEPKVTLGNEETTAESFESAQVQVKSEVIDPDNTKTTSKPLVFYEEEWERRKKTYVESVKRHMKEKGAANGVITELHTLMNTVASHQTGGNGPHWQHPSDLTQRNYLQSRSRCLLVSLDQWQKRNHLSHQYFAKVPDIFHRSPVL